MLKHKALPLHIKILPPLLDGLQIKEEPKSEEVAMGGMLPYKIL